MGVTGGFGLKLKITVSAALATIAGVTEADFPEFEKMLAESTSHDAPQGYAQYTDTGKKKLGEITAKINWDKAAASHAAILTAFGATAPVNMSIEDPAGAEVIAFSAHVKNIKRIAEQESQYTAEVKIQPTGAPTVTP